MAARAVPSPLAQLPNAITIMRLALIPVFLAFLIPAEGGRSFPAAIVFGVAGVSDQIDGFLARRWRVESRFGKIADPLADRLMIDAAILLLVVEHHRLPWIALALIVGRDLLLIVGYKLFAPRGIEVDVNLLGKLATWLLYLAVAMVMVTHTGASWPLWLFWIGLAGALAAAAVYVVDTWRTIRR